ncbi:hypothetical protein Cni_G26677 [Canna indica]|uniref:Formin-like protein n=1 Tax=Canna indica TaxID=4628 RepID=A0AAQ3KZW6_9LILI|nr:hypothetical protein Cni_G26677 [Canna indica]
MPSTPRRVLHLPFFPPPFPPADPPSSTTPQQPFFPSYPSPPPPLSPPQPSIAANISSLSRDVPPGRESSKIIASVLLPLLALALLAAAAAVFVLLRRRRRRKRRCPDPRRPFSFSSDGGTLKLPSSDAAAVSDFLHIGTVVDVRHSGSAEHGSRSPADAVGGAPQDKLTSPELHPLPPLPRQLQHRDIEGDMGPSSEEEFYSPRGSLAEKGSPRHMSSSRRTFSAAVEKCGSRSSTLSTPSYPSSSNLASSPQSSPVTSSPRLGSSPGLSRGRSLNSKTERSLAGSFEYDTPVSPPLPPPPTLTSSPPNRKQPSPSPPSSPVTRESEGKSETFDLDSANPRPWTKIECFLPNQLDNSSPPAPRKQIQAPPPPPPMPPVGYWLSQVQKPKVRLSSELLPSKPIETAVQSSNLDEMEKNDEAPRPKLKPLHWDKVHASSNRVMVWDQLKSSSFQVNEKMIETLFVCTGTNSIPKETNTKHVLPSPTQENRVLDPKKSQNIAILLRALNVTKEEVCEALLEGNADSLGTELLETLLKMAPTKEEEHKLKEYKDNSSFKLGPAEKFLKALLDVPFAFKRVDAMLYMANFDSDVNFLKNSFQTLEAACEELRSSSLFLKLLDAVLKTGNRMNVGTNRGDAHAFKLDTLLKLVDVKGSDGKTTLLHFVVQEIIRAEGSRLSASNSSAAKTQGHTQVDDLECRKLGLQVVAGLGDELRNVKKAAAMDFDTVRSYVSKLAGEIPKVHEVLTLNEAFSSKEGNQRFHDVVNQFLTSAEDDIIKVRAQESVALSLVKEITEYFHGNSAREEPHPFRIFMVVRDFLAILDQVCKEVGKINEHTTVSSGRELPVPVNPTLPLVFPRFHALRHESSDEESSLSP